MARLNQQLNNCIRITTAVCNPRQNSVQDKIQSETKSDNFFLTKLFFIRKKFLSEKKILSEFFFFQILFRTEFCLGLPVCFF